MASAAASVRSRGVEGLAASASTLFLTGMVAVGVLRDTMDTRGWQLAFFGWIAVIESVEYADTGDLLALLLAVGGAVMVVGLALDRFR